MLKILMFYIQSHYDVGAIETEINLCGAQVDLFHLFDDDISKIRANEYAVFDMRNCRGFQDHQERFIALYHELATIAKNANVKLITPEKCFSWIIQKHRYLKDLEINGVTINPTLFLDKTKDFDLANYISTQPLQDIIIKPSQGARAWGLYRVTMLNEQFVVSKPEAKTKTSKHNVLNSYLSASELNTFFSDYQKNVSTHVLLQEFIPSREYCLVYLGEKLSHVVEKCADPIAEKQGLAIRHDMYGCTIKHVLNPDPALIEFGNQVQSAKSEIFCSGQLPYYRIDVFEKVVRSGENFSPMRKRLSLNEIEALTVHLYLVESNSTRLFAKTMVQYAKQK